MKTLQRLTTLFMTAAMVLQPAVRALADPCGMVPPLWLGDGQPITRIGVQKTYVFYKDGIETFVIRPGFAGQVEEFGMLIPFPSPPAMRKVAEDVFAHVGAAVDPPEVLVDLREREMMRCCDMALPSAAGEAGLMYLGKGKEEVTVLRREAVGMYEVAVLEAGSAAALQRWMDDHGFRYPRGMDATCEEYIELGWCFVAVRARVGQKAGSDPRPGMREVETALPAGAGFDGHVQAMGFRFRTEEFVVPMRLSAFNPGELRNVVYILADTPQRIANLSEDFVVRQIPGALLYRNLTEPLPLRILGGDLEDIPDWRRQNLAQERDPLAHSGIARDLFASDLAAVRAGELAHPHEETEKTLLEIGERLGLRSAALDALHREAIHEEREALVRAALEDLRGMTLTVVDGDFPREVLAAENLRFDSYAMPGAVNSPRSYDAKHLGPAPLQTGSMLGATPGSGAFRSAAGASARALAAACLALLVLAALGARRHLVRVPARAAAALLLLSFAAAPRVDAAQGTQDEILTLIEDFAYPIEDAATLRVLVACGPEAVPRLIEEALSGSTPASRGWAVVALVEIGTDASRAGLATIADRSTSPLVRTWARAGQVQRSADSRELLALSTRSGHDAALERPLRMRWLELLAAPGAEAVEQVVENALEALALQGNLQQALLPAVLAHGSAPLVRVLTNSASTNARNLAAAALATLAGQGEPGVARAVIEAYRFDPSTELSAWEGGPLFLPALSWSTADARELTRHLIAWYVWCDAHGRAAERSQLHNNLRSVGLARSAGYEVPSQSEVDAGEWLVAYGKAAGLDALLELLAQQDLGDDPRYRRAVERVAQERRGWSVPVK